MTESPVTRPLAIPPLDPGRASGDSVTYSLAVQPGQTDFGLGTMTDTFGVNQSYLGPTLRMRTGDQVTVQVSNDGTAAATFSLIEMNAPPPVRPACRRFRKTGKWRECRSWRRSAAQSASQPRRAGRR